MTSIKNTMLSASSAPKRCKVTPWKSSMLPLGHSQVGTLKSILK